MNHSDAKLQSVGIAHESIALDRTGDISDDFIQPGTESVRQIKEGY